MQNPSSHPPPPPNLALPPGLAPPPGLSSLPPPAGPPPGIAPAAPPLEQASKDEKNSNSLVTIVKAQIVFLLSSINEDSFSSRVNDIRQVRRRPLRSVFLRGRARERPGPRRPSSLLHASSPLADSSGAIRLVLPALGPPRSRNLSLLPPPARQCQCSDAQRELQRARSERRQHGLAADGARGQAGRPRRPSWYVCLLLRRLDDAAC